MPNQTSPRSLTLHYKKGWFARFRRLTLVVDRVNVGHLKQGETIVLSLPEGAQALWGKMDWAHTVRFALDGLPDEATLRIEPLFTVNPLRALGLMPLPIRIVLVD